MPELPLYLSIPLTTLLSMLAVSTTPSCEFLIILLAFLKFQVAQSIAKKEILSVGYIFVGLSSGMTVAHFAPSLDALSSSSLGVFISGICLSITAAISIGLIYVSERNRTAFPGAAFALFPGIWTLAWMTVTQISPIGRLMTWSPFVGSVLDSYRWIRPFVGQPGLDFLVASWATLFSEIAGSYSGILGYRYTNDALIDLEDDDSHNSEGVIKTNHRMIPLLSFTSILLGLALPSFMVSSMPQPPFSPATVPLNVACILPAFQKAEEHSLGVYINETMQFTSRAKILLWPEGAVNFETPKDKMEGLARVQDALYSHSQNTWVGVSFQEPVSDGLQSGTRGRLRRTGLALVGSGGIEFEYYKRKLVPVAESFSHLASSDPAPVVELGVPITANAKRKGPKKIPTKSIHVSSAICLDASAPLAISHETKIPPALILIPARTWHPSVGYAMWQMAKSRAEETDTNVLWCDGGEGGLSGVLGPFASSEDGYQVGSGSFVKTIGLAWPPRERSTIYGSLGDALPLILIFASMGLVYVAGQGSIAWKHSGRNLQGMGAWARGMLAQLNKKIRPGQKAPAHVMNDESESLI